MLPSEWQVRSRAHALGSTASLQGRSHVAPVNGPSQRGRAAPLQPWLASSRGGNLACCTLGVASSSVVPSWVSATAISLSSSSAMHPPTIHTSATPTARLSRCTSPGLTPRKRAARRGRGGLCTRETERSRWSRDRRASAYQSTAPGLDAPSTFEGCIVDAPRQASRWSKGSLEDEFVTQLHDGGLRRWHRWASPPISAFFAICYPCPGSEVLPIS